LIGSVLALALAFVNPEAFRADAVAERRSNRGYKVILQAAADNAPAQAGSASADEPPRRSAPLTTAASRAPETRSAAPPAESAVRARPASDSRRVLSATPEHVTAAPAATDDPAANSEPIRLHNPRRGPSIFIEASRERPSPRAPVVSLGPVEEADDAPTPESAASSSPHVAAAPFGHALKGQGDSESSVLAALLSSRLESSRIESHLVNLQRQVDQLAQARSQEQSHVLQRATQILDKIEQTAQLQSLERQLQQLQGTAANNGGAPAAVPAAAAASSSAPPAEDAPPSPAPESTGKESPVLKAEPKGAGSERLNLTIQDAEVTQVLKMLGEMSGTNILIGKDVTGKVTANLQDVSVEQALAGILRSLGFAFEREGRFIFVMTAADAEARQKAGRKLITKVYRPNYISVADLQALVTPLLSPTMGKVAITAPAEVGIAPSRDNAGGNRISQQDALLVQDYPEVIREVDNVLIEMDVPPMQVVIETMILSVTLDDSMQFGVNFALLGGNNKDLFVSGNGRTLNNSSGFPGTGTGSIVPPMGQFIADTAGLKYGFLRGDMSLFINALEEIADTNVIAAPQLRVLNKQKAELIIGEKLSYTTSTFNQTQTIENVQFLDVGTKLILRPFIAPDGMVRMEIHPERSSGGINPQTQLPDLETTEVTTNVMVRDGCTVVIGGLIEEQTQESSSRIPLLGAIPVVGNVFKNKTEKVVRSELIILITPRIAVDPEDAAEGDAARYEHERRAGYFRDHLSPVNRTNLARMEYERACDLYEQGDLLRAKAHVIRALRHSKNDIEALRLRDQIDQALQENTNRLLHFSSPAEAAGASPAAPAAEDEAIEFRPPAPAPKVLPPPPGA